LAAWAELLEIGRGWKNNDMRQHEMSALCRRDGGLRVGTDRQASDRAADIFFLPMRTIGGPK
jgi:hypothetical protein